MMTPGACSGGVGRARGRGGDRGRERASPRAGVESARLDAELLMAAAAGVSRATLFVGDARRSTRRVLERFERMVARREAREPLAYIVGHREFYSLEFEVRPGVLVPRPETETVVEAALGFLRERPDCDVLDIGTGSGAIAIAIAANAPGVRIVAIDISKVSLEIAAENRAAPSMRRRIAFIHGRLCRAGRRRCARAVRLIVSNPPYIAEAELARWRRRCATSSRGLRLTAVVTA